MAEPVATRYTPAARYAADERRSIGRQYSEPEPGYRNHYQRDRDRIVHCAAFRRLEYKTQVFVNHEGDLFRTRLTHSVEVAQIARSAARALGLHEDLIEAIALAHDLGHTPFGHAGQDALNQCMKEYGGFEHNLQSLRVVDYLEAKYAEFDGLNLMFETREGILKHCARPIAADLEAVGRRFLDGTQPGLEAQLANVCDEIAYNNHDVDDGLRSGLITIDQLLNTELFRDAHNAVEDRYPQLGTRRKVHEIVRRMINRQVTDLIETTRDNIKRAGPRTIDDVRGHERALAQFSDEMWSLHKELKQFLRANLYRHSKVRRMTVKAQQLINDIFAAYMEDPLLLPGDEQDNLARSDPWPFIADGVTRRARIVADYIAGMTDRYAIAERERLFNPKVTS